ncbi:MAG: crossover junction endodeoxyribonuclease RuvC [Roseivirga sp.]|jgi:crossover junction endodeoxyribonuclease RuvC
MKIVAKSITLFLGLRMEKIILGIDPGTQVMGFGVIRIKAKKIELINLGSISFKVKDSAILRLKEIFESTLKLVEEYLPDEMAVEAPFFGKNVQSMLKLGRAQGVIMAAGLYRNIPIEEYAPRKIKQSITGKGSASKEQVYAMLEKTFEQKLETKSLDASDGLAVALCHYYQASNPLAGLSGKGSWDKFIRNNPDRIS